VILPEVRGTDEIGQAEAMTQPPHPPYGPAPVARRRRPSAWWFVVGGALVVAAVVAGVSLFVLTLGGFLDSDATVRADGRTETVRLDGDERRMLWTDDAHAQQCEVVDAATGEGVKTSPVTGNFTRSEGDDDWTGAATFDAASGTVEVTCTGDGTVIVGPAPAIDSFVLGLLATIFVPLFLGGGGLVVLIVTGVLFATGRP
jgi:hypothetical protein